jgi:hypothetical protein
MEVRQNERHLLRTTNFLWKYLTYRELYRDLKSSVVDDSSKMEPQFHSKFSTTPAQQVQPTTSPQPIEIQPKGKEQDR